MNGTFRTTSSIISHALLLAIGSSTDNFTVGFALGIKTSLDLNSKENKRRQKRRTRGESLDWRFNLCISTANAIGAGLAGSFGHIVLHSLSKVGGHDQNANNESASLFMPFSSMSGNQFASMLAGIAFYYLSFVEFSGILIKNDDSTNTQAIHGGSMKDAFQLAVPMTLNNLAGGVAGGTAGISANMSFILALLCSYVMMSLGYLIGRTFRSRWIEQQANVIAGAVFGILGNLQILDCIE